MIVRSCEKIRDIFTVKLTANGMGGMLKTSMQKNQETARGLAALNISIIQLTRLLHRIPHDSAEPNPSQLRRALGISHVLEAAIELASKLLKDCENLEVEGSL